VPLSERLGAFLALGRFDLAAAAVDCDPDTVSRTWHAWRRQIAAELFGDGAACRPKS
jgi:hypothetical protein